MHSLLHAPFLQALGYAIVNSLWQFALLWLLYFGINTIFKLSSHQKYTTGIVLEFAGFAWFLETLYYYYNQSLLFVHNISDYHHVSLPSLINNSGSLRQQFFMLVLRSEQFFPYLSIAYLSLLFILTIKWFYAYIYTQKVRTKGLRQIENNWHVFVQNLSLQLAIKRTVRIFLSELVQTPLTIGFIKPLILIPVATVNYLTPQQLEAVILHELAHIKRFDYFFNLLLAFIKSSLFFNPFMQLLHYQIKKERENCCDDWVIKYQYSASCYAHALLQIASHQTQLPLLALKATDNKKLLITRIKRIIENNERPFFNYKHQLLALVVMTTVFSSLSLLSPSKKIVSSSSSAVKSNMVFEPIVAKVKNPLFNPVFFLATSSKKVTDQKKKAGETKPGKINIQLKRLTPPPGFPVPAEADAGVEEENDNLVEETSAPSSVHLIEASKEKNAALQKVKFQLKKALDQIMQAREQAEYKNVQEFVTTGIKSLQKEKSNKVTSEANLTIDKLELIEKQVERVLDSINLQDLYTPVLNSDLNINFQIPAVIYTFPRAERQHAFSYEYSKAPRIKIVNTPAASECGKVKKRKQKVSGRDDEDGIEQNEFFVPPPPPIRVRTLRVIKI